MVKPGKVRGARFNGQRMLWKLRGLGALGALRGLRGTGGLGGLRGLRTLGRFGERGLRLLPLQGAADHRQLFGEATLGGQEVAKSSLVSHFHLGQEAEKLRAGGDRDAS